MNEMRTENWMGYDIRFIQVDDEWWAILKDICDALQLRTKDVSQRLDPSMMLRVQVEGERNRPARYKDYEDGLNDIVKSRNTYWMLAVNENGIYEALFASRRLEARKFRMWTSDVLKKLRKRIGLEQYEVMRMTEPEIQEDIDHMLDDIFYDEETGMLMESYTVAGGDVEQRPFEGQKGENDA